MKLRFVKFLTSRENEIEKKEEEGGALPSRAPPSPSQAAARARFRSPLLSSSFPFFLPPPSPTSPHPTAQLVGRHVSGEQYSPAIPLPTISLLPSFFIKSPKQQSVAVVTWRSTLPADPASRSSCSVRAPSSPQARAFRYLACPPSSPPSPSSRSGSSTSSEAIGKQRPKMRFPVSFPSLTNK